MNPVMQAVVTISAVVAAASTICIAVFIYRMWRRIEDRGLVVDKANVCDEQLGGPPHCHTAGYTDTETMTGHAVYVYKRGLWHLEADLSSPGCETTPPSIVGSFDGQVVRRQAQMKA